MAKGKGYLLEQEIADHFRVPVRAVRKTMAPAELSWLPRLRTYSIEGVADVVVKMHAAGMRAVGNKTGSDVAEAL